MKKFIYVINGNQPCLEIKESDKIYCYNRDRNPDNDWNEIRLTLMSEKNCKFVELTDELKQILIEDLAYFIGKDSNQFIKFYNDLIINDGLNKQEIHYILNQDDKSIVNNDLIRKIAIDGNPDYIIKIYEPLSFIGLYPNEIKNINIYPKHISNIVNNALTIINMEEDNTGRDNCTYGDTNYDSQSVVFGRNEMLQQIKEILNKQN